MAAHLLLVAWGLRIFLRRRFFSASFNEAAASLPRKTARSGDQ